ncbi:hypothetical protein GCM10027592_29230 [Spirosoma flavus]
MKKTTPKPIPGERTAAFLIQMGIEQLRKSPSLRTQCQISLVDLEAAGKVRRKLLKQIPK